MQKPGALYCRAVCASSTYITVKEESDWDAAALMGEIGGFSSFVTAIAGQVYSHTWKFMQHLKGPCSQTRSPLKSAGARGSVATLATAGGGGVAEMV